MIPNECASNDSPWLICKPCVSDGKCKIADQLKAAQVAVLREAANKLWSIPSIEVIQRMADELEEQK